MNPELLLDYSHAIAKRSNHVAQEEILAILRRYASRLPKECHDDYLSMVMLRVYETAKKDLSGREIRRAADASRKRLIRELKKLVSVDEGQEAVSSYTDTQQRQRELFRLLSTKLSPNEAVAIKARMEGFNAKEIAEVLNVSERTAYRIQREAIAKIRTAWDAIDSSADSEQ